jgi:hypothetical protein
LNPAIYTSPLPSPNTRLSQAGTIKGRAVNGTICLYYYLKVIYPVYFIDDPGLPAITLSIPIRLLNYALAAIIIGFGFYYMT